MSQTSIEWTEKVWNPVTGCSKVSEGCRNCYAERMSHRFKWTEKPWNHLNAKENVKLHPERLEQPLMWKKPSKIFVNSMSDLFHEEVPFSFISKVFHTMWLADHHIFQILTKRPERMLEYFNREETMFEIIDADVGVNPLPLSNVWIGVSVENQKAADERIPLLLQTPAAVRFLSCEPLLGPIELKGHVYQVATGLSEYIDWLTGRTTQKSNVFGGETSPWLYRDLYEFPKDYEEPRIHWVIVGGESGPKARPIDPDWVRSLRDQCQAVKVPFFFKQWGGTNKKKNGRLLDGKEYNEMPGGIL